MCQSTEKTELLNLNIFNAATPHQERFLNFSFLLFWGGDCQRTLYMPAKIRGHILQNHHLHIDNLHHPTHLPQLLLHVHAI